MVNFGILYVWINGALGRNANEYKKKSTNYYLSSIIIRWWLCWYVPESGRLFVWGENQFGQLGIGSTEIVTKPSCVKAIKALGYKVRNVAYGQAFGVILTGQYTTYFSVDQMNCNYCVNPKNLNW